MVQKDQSDFCLMLLAAEQKYIQIEKETSACVFAIKRYHSYPFGHRFTLNFDHKPLINAYRAISNHTSNKSHFMLGTHTVHV